MSPSHIARTLNRVVSIEKREDYEVAVFSIREDETTDELLTRLGWTSWYNIHSAQDADYVELPL